MRGVHDNPIYGLGGSSTAPVTPFRDTHVDLTALSHVNVLQLGLALDATKG